MELEERIADLEFQVRKLRGILEDREWVSSQEMAKFLGISPFTLTDWINRTKRGQGKLIYGVHFRDKRSPGAKRATYQFNVVKMQEYMRVKPEYK